MKTDTNRRLLLGASLGAALAPLSVRAQTPLTGRYGIVEIGSSGVKATALSFAREEAVEPSEPGSPSRDGLSRAERYRANTLGSFTDDPVVRDAAQIPETVRAVENAIRQLRNNDSTNVTRENIYVVGSSSVAVLQHRPQLEQALARRNITATFISATDEAELTFRYVVLPSRWQQAVLVDVGLGNTKGGYINNTGAFSSFRAFDVPYGSTWSSRARNGAGRRSNTGRVGNCPGRRRPRTNRPTTSTSRQHESGSRLSSAPLSCRRRRLGARILHASAR